MKFILERHTSQNSFDKVISFHGEISEKDLSDIYGDFSTSEHLLFKRLQENCLGSPSDYLMVLSMLFLKKQNIDCRGIKSPILASLRDNPNVKLR